MKTLVFAFLILTSTFIFAQDQPDGKYQSLACDNFNPSDSQSLIFAKYWELYSFSAELSGKEHVQPSGATGLLTLKKTAKFFKDNCRKIGREGYTLDKFLEGARTDCKSRCQTEKLEEIADCDRFCLALSTVFSSYEKYFALGYNAHGCQGSSDVPSKSATK